MTDNVIIPHHLRVFAETWGEFVTRLDHVVVTPPSRINVRLAREDVPRFVELSTRETTALQSWINRVTTWFNGPMTMALTNADIRDANMRRIAERFSHFADELSERRDGLKALEHDSAMQAAVPRLDAVYASLLVQMREFAEKIVNALGPQARTHPSATHQGDNIELSFTFRPCVDKPMADFMAWIRRTHAWLDADATPLVLSDSTKNPEDAVYVVCAIVFIVALVAAMIMFGFYTVILVIALIGIVIFIIRHPYLSLLALFFGLN